MSDVLEGLDEVVEEPVAPVEDKQEETEVKEEIKADVKESAKEDEPKKTIPLASYLEDKRKWREENERSSAELKAIRDELERLKNPPKAPEPTPDFTQDPKGYVDHRVKDALAALEAGKTEVEGVRKTAEQASAEAQMTRFMTDLTNTEAVFVKEAPDYYDALNHIRQSRAAQLQTLVPDMTPDQIAQQIRKEELGMAHQLMLQGRNPHEYAYRLAKTYGYQKKAEAPALPDVKKTPTLAPDKTLGSSGGGDVEDEKAPDEFDRAFGEVFGRKRA